MLQAQGWFMLAQRTASTPAVVQSFGSMRGSMALHLMRLYIRSRVKGVTGANMLRSLVRRATTMTTTHEQRFATRESHTSETALLPEGAPQLNVSWKILFLIRSDPANPQQLLQRKVQGLWPLPRMEKPPRERVLRHHHHRQACL